ncbi:hypothetical protein VPBG_00246 [Vibrio phage helene 12B3]|uniref:hypothetical protein n=1 Tax=Vibrio phage helene 12B3 TaxID=573173 RepID=UPI0002C0FEFB|nr:hypothetical protein VPBG_00246 [Vibrio phage helene 12B3]YP_009222863.1 hypothetical protein VPLG_00014 [Vibrio phage eugene 12A10]AGG58018.1 hypothetical protein VPBG_00246 [Vibrio phage helene 12B3]AGN51453.1 hypothetical protein VPLG_00014 [Vibrio phage eugene 12A10]
MTKQTIFTHEFATPDHEIIIKLKSDDFDWIDPIDEVWINNNTLYVDNGRGVYDYKISDIVDYNIREYNSENIYDYQGGNL